MATCKFYFIKTQHISLLFTLLCLSACARQTQLPPFLPDYYQPALDMGKQKLSLVQHSGQDNVEQYIYATSDESIVLSIENITCDRSQANAIFNNLLVHVNNTISSNAGEFIEISDTEFNAEVVESNVTKNIFTYVLPTSIQIWSFALLEPQAPSVAQKFGLIRSMANQQRYTEAYAKGNVAMGHWGSSIYDHAIQLLDEGEIEAGIDVLKKHLQTSPNNYDAHVTYLKYADDLASASNSAQIVFSNAEKRSNIEAAARFLGKDTKRFEDIPYLESNETGLQLILIPLPPCNPWLLEEAADVFEQITGIPTKINRIVYDWTWSSPGRMSQQRTVQSVLLRLTGETIDFTDWTKDTYTDKLKEIAKSQDALSRYNLNELIKTINEEPDQYLVDPYLDHFCKLLIPIRSYDKRTMYVGITEANIYSGDNNFLFSLGRSGMKTGASILSYYMMLGDTLGADYASRQRLTERIAKELVPAALKQLDIPRSTDPSCPYSYSSGVGRLDQKTLKLSEPVKTKLEGLKKDYVE